MRAKVILTLVSFSSPLLANSRVPVAWRWRKRFSTGGEGSCRYEPRHMRADKFDPSCHHARVLITHLSGPCRHRGGQGMGCRRSLTFVSDRPRRRLHACLCRRLAECLVPPSVGILRLCLSLKKLGSRLTFDHRYSLQPTNISCLALPECRRAGACMSIKNACMSLVCHLSKEAYVLHGVCSSVHIEGKAAAGIS